MSSFEARCPPAIGATVRIANGEWRGELGTVHGHRSGNVIICIDDVRHKFVTAPFTDLQWNRTMPPVGTLVAISMLEGWEGTRGRVTGYASVTTSKITQTQQGRHYGRRAVVVRLMKGREEVQLPFYPENLLWNRLAPEVVTQPEEMPIPEAGRMTGDMTHSELLSQQRPPRAEQLPVRRSGLFQLRLLPHQSRFAVRQRPAMNASIHSHLRNGDVVSLFLPLVSFPEWWEVETGGFIHKKDEEWVPLVMSCGVCDDGPFVTEQALEGHFRREHPSHEFKVSIAGNFFPGPEPAPEVLTGHHHVPHHHHHHHHHKKQTKPKAAVDSFVLIRPRRGFDGDPAIYRSH